MAYTAPGSPFGAPPVSMSPTPSMAPPNQGPLFDVNPWWAPSAQTRPTAQAADAATVINTLGTAVPAPGEQTPEQLTSNIESSIAKLETVDPDLAQKYRDQYLGEDKNTEGGLIDGLKSIGGDILGGAGKALEMIGRTSHIVPAMLKQDEDPWYQDLSEALSGKDKTTFNDVFQSYGWTGDGTSGTIRAALGFALDLGADPLTYATFGAGAGASAAEKAALTAKAVATRSVTLAEKGAALGLGDAAKTAESLDLVWNAIAGNAPDVAKLKGLVTNSEEAAQLLARQAGHVVTDAHRALVSDMFEAGAKTYDGVMGRTFSKWVRKGNEIQLKSGTVLNPKDTKTILEQIVKEGRGQGAKSSQWLMARSAAGALGGVRFAPYVPFTSLRYISPMLPFSNTIQPLARIGRFASGLSASKRMEWLIRHSKASYDDMAMLHQMGWSGLRNPKTATSASRKLYKQLAEGGAARSAFYSASEMMGRATQTLSPGSRMYRQGLGYYFMQSRMKAVAGTVDDITKRQMYDVLDETKNGVNVTGSGEAQLHRLEEDVWGISNRAGKDTASAEDRTLYRKYLDLVGGSPDIPTSVEDVNTGKLDAWFWARADVQAKLAAAKTGEEGSEAVAKRELDDRLLDVKDVLSKVTGQRREVADMKAKVWQRGMELMNHYGSTVRDIRYKDLSTVGSIHNADAAVFGSGTPDMIAKQRWYARSVEQDGLTDADVAGHGDEGVEGILLTTHPTGGPDEGWYEVVPNVRKPLVTGKASADDPAERLLAETLADDPRIAEHQLQAEQEMTFLRDKALEASPTHELESTSMLHPDNWERTKAERVTRLLKADGGPQYDSVVRRGENGETTMVLMGSGEIDPWDQVRILNPHAARVKQSGGYYPRGFKRQLRTWLNGEGGDRIVRMIPEMEANILRRTADLTYEEAETAARKHLVEALRKEGAAPDVIAQLLKKEDDGSWAMEIFEGDPLRAHEDYIHRVGESVTANLMGDMAERMDALGKLLPVHFGRVAHIAEAQVIDPPGVFAAVRRTSIAASKAKDRVDRRAAVLDTYAEKSANRETTRVGDLIDRWAAGEDIDLVDLADKNPGLSRLLSASDNVREVLKQQRETVTAERQVWINRSRDTDAVEDLLEVTDQALTPGEVGRLKVKELEKYVDPNHPLKPDSTGRFGHLSADEYAALKEDIRINGIQSPILLRYNQDTGMGIMEDGYHRLAAAKELGMEDVPVILQPLGAEEKKLLAGLNSPGADVPMDKLVKDKGVVMRPLPDGRTRIVGWHGNGPPPEGAVFGFGGFHFGTRGAAEARLMSSDINEVAVDVLDDAGEIVDTEYVLGRDVEAFIERSKAENPEFDYRQQEMDSWEAHEFGEDDLEQAIDQVAVEGRFLGAKSPMTDRSANDLAEAFGRGDEEAIRRLEGYDGIVYKNDVEDAGSVSVVVLNPEKVIQISGELPMDKLVTPTKGTKVTRDQVASLLERGELGIDSKGTITTRSGEARKAGKGGARRIYTRQEIAAALHDVNGRLDELDLFDANPARAFDRGAPASAKGRLVPMAEQDELALKGRDVLDRVNGGARREVVQGTDELIAGAHDSVKTKWGGQTIDMKTGRTLPKGREGYAAGKVATEDTVQLTIDEAQDAAKFAAAFRKAEQRFASDLGLNDVNMGVFRNEDTGMVTLEPSIYLDSADDAEALVTHLGSRGGAHHLTGDEINVFPARTRRTPLESGAERVVKASRSLGKEVERQATREAKVAGRTATQTERLTRSLREAEAELNRRKAAYNGAEADMLPAIQSANSAGDKSGMRQLDLPGLEGVWMHAYMAEELDHLLRGKPTGELRRMWRSFVLDPWKKWATYRSPGFHVRNAMGGWFNNAIGGVVHQDYGFSFRMMSARDGGKWATKALDPAEFRRLNLHTLPGVRGFEGKLTYGQLADMLSDMGMTRGSATAVAMVSGGTQETLRLKAKGKALGGPRAVDNFLRNKSSLTEDYFRTAAWAAGMRTTGGDLYGSRAFVMVRHGDYSDLTETEAFVKDLVPFYKWMRTNVPYQLRTLAEEPGKLLTMQKIQSKLYGSVGETGEYESNVPDWMKQSLNVPIPTWVPLVGSKGGDSPANMMSFNLPYGDLHKGTREYVSSFLPVVSDIIQGFGLKTDVFTGKELGSRMVPLGGWAQVPGIKHAIAAMPFAQMSPDGEVYIPDTLDKVLSAAPPYGRFRNWLTGDPNRVERRWGAMTSFFIGAGTRQIDLNGEERSFFYDVLTPQLDMYKSMGVVFPTKDELVAAGRLVQSAPAADAGSLFPGGAVGEASTLPWWAPTA